MTDVLTTLPAFLLAILLISASPGPAMALILRRAAVRGARGALPTVLGLETGIYLWALAAGAGLAALVAASETAYLVLKVVGAVVLLGLGARAWVAAWRGDAAAEAPPPTARGAFAEGVAVNLANPKAAVFMFAFYPQFVPDDGSLLLWTAGLGLFQIAIETALYLGFAAAVGRASGWLGRSRVRRRLEAVSGTVMVALGVRLAASSR